MGGQGHRSARLHAIGHMQLIHVWCSKLINFLMCQIAFNIWNWLVIVSHPVVFVVVKLFLSDVSSNSAHVLLPLPSPLMWLHSMHCRLWAAKLPMQWAQEQRPHRDEEAAGHCNAIKCYHLPGTREEGRLWFNTNSSWWCIQVHGNHSEPHSNLLNSHSNHTEKSSVTSHNGLVPLEHCTCVVEGISFFLTSSFSIILVEIGSRLDPYSVSRHAHAHTHTHTHTHTHN